MASERLTAVFDAVDNISKTLQGIDTSVEDLDQSIEGLSNQMEDSTMSSQALQTSQERLADAADSADRSVEGLSRALAESGVNSQAANAAHERAGSTIDDLASEVDEARRAFESLNIVQGMTTAQAATNAGAMEIAGNAIDEMGDDALKTAGQMGVLNTVMEELSLSGSALSINIGAFNVSLRNLAPLVPIAASMGSVVTVMGAFISSLGAATVALGAFTAAGALGFMENMQAEFDGLTDSAETMEAVMGGIKDLFVEALEPLRSAGNTQFFVNLIEGSADFVNRLAQAISQMRDDFMPLFSGFSDIMMAEFDNVANGIGDMMDRMTPILLTTFEWFMQHLPDALRFMGRVTQDLVGPLGNLGNSVLDLLTSIIETAVQIIQGLAPAFAIALDVATALVDVFNALSNGFLQATLFLGGLTLAATKFVGIADTIANVGISAANTFSQWAGQIRNVGGILPRLNQALSNQFEHLKALGSVLTGNMSIQQASGQVQRDFKEEVQDFARALLEAEDGSQQLRNKLIQLQAVMEGGGFEEAEDKLQEFQDELDDTGDKVDNKMDTVAGAAAEGMGSATDEMDDAADSVSGMDFGTDAAQAEIDELTRKSGGAGEVVQDAADDMADSMDGVDGAFQSSLGSFESFDSSMRGAKFKDASGQLASFDDVVQEADADLMKASDSMDEMGGAFARSADDIDDSQAVLTAFGGEADEMSESLSMTQATLSDFGDETDDTFDSMAAVPEGAFTAFDDFDDDVANAEETLDKFGASALDMDEQLGEVSTEAMFAAMGEDMPDLPTDMAESQRKEFQTALQFDEDWAVLHDPWERADMDPPEVDTSNLDAIKGKLGDFRDRAQAFGKRTSDAMRRAGGGIKSFALGAGDEIGGAAGEVKNGLDVIKGAAQESMQVVQRELKIAGGVTGLLSNGLTKARRKMGAMKTAAFNAAGALGTMARNAWASIKALVAQGAQAVRAAMSNWALAFSQGGVVAGFKAMAASAWGAVTGLAAAAAGAITTAASFVAGLIPATLSAGLALNTAFAGIPAILGAIVALSAVAVGVLGNMDGVTSGLKGAFDGLKSAIGQIGDALLSVGVPAWNLFIDIMEAILSPVFAIIDGFALIGEALGIAGGEGGFLMGIIGGLLDGFSALMNIIGAMFNFVAPAFSFIGDIIYSAFIIPFQIVATTISIAMELLQGLVALAIKHIPFMSELVGGLQAAFQMVIDAIAQIPAFFDTVASMIGGTIDAIVGGIKAALEPAVNFINGLIDQANKVPEVDIEKVDIGDFGGGAGGASEALSGAQTSAEEVRENVRSSEEEPGDDVATQPDVSMSLEDSVENNVEVQADPEDKAQLSRITKDALEEANSFARRQQGGQ